MEVKTFLQVRVSWQFMCKNKDLITSSKVTLGKRCIPLAIFEWHSGSPDSRHGDHASYLGKRGPLDSKLLDSWARKRGSGAWTHEDRQTLLGVGRGREGNPEVEWVFVPSSFSIVTLVSALLPTSSAAGAENMGFRWSSRKWSWAASRGVGLGELQRQLGGKRNRCRHTCLGHLFLCGPGSHQVGTSCITPIISTLWLKAEQ